MSSYLDSHRIKNHYIKDIKHKVLENSIFYKNPSQDWVDSHPLGNGDMGVMVTGSPNSFKFYFSKSDIWDNRTVREGKSVFPKKSYKQLLKIVEDKDTEEFNRLAKQAMIDYSGTNYPSPQSCGLLEVKFGNCSFNNYYQLLNLYNGTEKVSWSTDNGNYNLSCFVNQNQNISEYNIEFTDLEVNRLEISLYRLPSDLYKQEKMFSLENFLGFEFIFPDGLKYLNVIYIDADDIEITKDFKAKLTSNTSSNIRIIQTIVTSYETEDLKELAFKRIEEYRSKDRNKIKQKSDKFWADFWNRSYVDIQSKEAEKVWYTGLYLIASSSRKGAAAMPALQGIWTENYDPPWKGDIHTDMDVQATYWPVYTSNHLDIAEPFYRCYVDMIAQFKKDTKEYFGVNGVKIPCTHDIKGKDLGGYLALCPYWIGGSAWIASHFIKNYQYSQDKDFLKNIAFPFLAECIKFYNGILKKNEDGKYIIYLSYIPEEMEQNQIEAIDNNPTIDLAFVKNLYRSFIDIVSSLEHEVDLDLDMDLVKDINENVSDYPQENGHLTDSENKDFNYSHRHPSFLAPIFPLGEINGFSSTKDNYSLGANSLYKFIKRGNTSKRMWMSFTYVWLSCIASTLGLKDFANIYLSDYLDSFVNKKNRFHITFDYKRKGRGINLDNVQEMSVGTKYEFNEKIFLLQVNCSSLEAINLMLLQSFNGELSIFPAYPWKNGFFEGLRGEGGFLVSSRLKDWKISSLFVESLYGNKATIYLDKDVKNVSVKNLSGGGKIKISKIDNNELDNKIRFSFDTKAGCEYEIKVEYCVLKY